MSGKFLTEYLPENFQEWEDDTLYDWDDTITLGHTHLTDEQIEEQWQRHVLDQPRNCERR
jgi:hypothetical protein